MIRVIFALAAFAASLAGGNQQEDVNVNSRYTVESVNITGKRSPQLSPELKKELDAVVGQKLDHGVLDRLAGRLRRDLRVENVSIRVGRGRMPDHVTVEFEIQDGQRRNFDLDATKFAYHSRQGWTGASQARTFIGENTLAFGVVSDGDELVERFSGIRARVERRSVGSSRVRLGFAFDTYHQQWNSSTLTAAGTAGAAELYRSRMNFQPTATVVLGEPLTWTVGLSIQRLEFQVPAARTRSANSVVNTLRYHKSWEDGSSTRHNVDAGYNLRAATSMLGSDFGYTRHLGDVRYEIVNGHNGVTLDVIAGGSTGNAPMFERFVLGTASTLRGWSKFDLAPLGADRIVHGSIDYRHRVFTVFYDAGVVWTGTVSSGAKQSGGFGLRTGGREGFLLAVAFPFRAGHVDPMFIAGFNF